MASSIVNQFAFRAQKQFGLATGAPSYGPIEAFQKPEVTVRTHAYSTDGRFLAYVLPNCVTLLDAETCAVLREIQVSNVIDISFSPKGTFLSTWERPVKLEDGAQHKNLRIFEVATGEQVTAFTQKSMDSWDVQYTISESHALRLVSSDVQVFHPADWSKSIAEKVKIEGATAMSVSPGRNPSVAVFVAEKNGAPAGIKVLSLATLAAPPTCAKSFFKSDRVTMKWNAGGTHVLALTQTDVDAANKSYYGETGLYLLSATGTGETRVGLDKEGPIHDFAWSPNGREFCVIYGFMPAKAVLFDARVRTVHDFGAHPQNFVSFSPTGRLLALAGFGNLAGRVELWDRTRLTKLTTLDAPNTSHFAWSPDGLFVMTATLSPRLRVDNGVKLWHCTGTLVHTLPVDELYQATWRPHLVNGAPMPFPATIPAPPSPSLSIVAAAPDGTSTPPAKPAGAYRPPGARGLATPLLFKREDEGGARYVGGGSGAATPNRYGNGSPKPPGENGNGHHPHANANVNGRGGARGRHVPGAPPREDREREPEKEKRARTKKKKAPGGGEELPPLEMPPAPDFSKPEAVETPEVMSPGGEAALDPVAKKIRNLTKKLKAIEELKEKHKRGEKLEATQVKKMEGEAEIVQQLAALQT